MTSQQALELCARKLNSMKPGCATILVSQNGPRVDVKFQTPWSTYGMTVDINNPLVPTDATATEAACEAIIQQMLFVASVGPPKGEPVNSEGKPLFNY